MSGYTSSPPPPNPKPKTWYLIQWENGNIIDIGEETLKRLMRPGTSMVCIWRIKLKKQSV